MALSYDQFRRALEGVRLPALIVDIDAFDRNLARVLRDVEPSALAIRVATKSLRIPALLTRLLDRGGGALRGLMCSSVEEAELLADQGFDDLLVAYPPAQASEVERAAALTARGVRLSVAFDDREHLERLSKAGAALDARIRVVLCADMSLRLLGDRIHLGVRRSPVATPEAALELARAAARLPGVVFHGLLGYEAQIAGLPDARRGDATRWAKRAIRRRSIGAVRARRAAIIGALREDGHDVSLVNGGGTGSLDSTTRDPTLTEITCGSAFFKPHLFDDFTNAHVRELEPACFFALEVTRIPGPRYVTCLGGGYVASGPGGRASAPKPWLPTEVALLDGEGAGEVQTPLHLSAGARIGIGDPILFRHAKAGEVAERFREALLVSGDRVLARVPTYRGMGACFF
jgi:D-serine deaminase-like pyridoxal phosphate-dependent protein